LLWAHDEHGRQLGQQLNQDAVDEPRQIAVYSVDVGRTGSNVVFPRSLMLFSRDL
jgi:hypothetical protein